LDFGKRCIDIPVDSELFLQLGISGPPATQYFPSCFGFFCELKFELHAILMMIEAHSNQ
jgi:hypothetical protein